MRVTIDLDREIIIIPDNFFRKIAEDNERLEKYGAKPVKPIERIKRAFETAMADTDKRLLTQSNARVKRNTAKSGVIVQTIETPAESSAATTDKK